MFCCFFLYETTAFAETILFRLDGSDDGRLATVDLIERQRVGYVSLAGLMKQVGGGCKVESTLVQADLGGISAQITINEKVVDASFSHFTLRRPLLWFEGDALISVGDVPVLFEKAFRTKLEVVRDSNSTPLPAADNGTVSRSRYYDVPSEALDTRFNAELGAVPYYEAKLPGLRTVVLDAGHGGTDTGTVGRGGLQEKTATLTLVKKIGSLLKQNTSLDVLLTRSEDADVSILERANFANTHNADFLISIHLGASLANSAHGFEIFFPPAEKVHALNPIFSSNMTAFSEAAISPEDKRVREIASMIALSIQESTGAKHRGLREFPCKLFKHAAVPGLIIEVGCLSNATEETLLQMESYQDKLALAIANALTAHLTSLD